MAKGGSETAVLGLEDQEDAGEYRPTDATRRSGGGTGTGDPDQAAPMDPNRRFDDLDNLISDPAFLLVAWKRVKDNRGARTAGVDGQTAR
jgi:hypothetical protein